MYDMRLNGLWNTNFHNIHCQDIGERRAEGPAACCEARGSVPVAVGSWECEGTMGRASYADTLVPRRAKAPVITPKRHTVPSPLSGDKSLSSFTTQKYQLRPLHLFCAQDTPRAAPASPGSAASPGQASKAVLGFDSG